MSLVKFFMFKVLIAMSYPSSGMLIGRKMRKTNLAGDLIITRNSVVTSMLLTA